VKTANLKMKGDWQEVVDDCRSTVSKPSLGHEPSEKFKRSILVAEHSPIRDISFRWRWDGIKSWVATHFARHHWECRISTQRSDRTGVPRDKLPQDAPVTFVGEANAQALIDTMRKRLCFQAASETREYAEDLKQAITEVQPEIGFVLTANCCYRGACPEFHSCGYWGKLTANCTKEQLISIEERYKIFNDDFNERCKKREREKNEK